MDLCRLFLSLGGMEEEGQLKRVVIDATAGLIAGAISRTVTSPLDVIKIRFQVGFQSMYLLLDVPTEIVIRINYYCALLWS